MLNKIPDYTLNDGSIIPSIGLGCFMGDDVGGQRVNDMIEKALKVGYTHFDTATGYGNEKQVGQAIRASGIARNQLYITTKLANVDHHRVREAFEQSLAELDCDYIDLYLMHWPQAAIADESKPVGNTHFLRVRKPDESPTFIETYKEMEKLLETGKVKSIGVSNFSIKTLEILLPHVKVVPAVNQVEVHPCLPQEDLIKYCKEKGILIVAYSPLGRSTTFFQHEEVKKITLKYGATPAQVILSWGIQRETAVIPKSENEQRLKDNLTLFNLTQEDVESIDKIHKEPGMHKSLFPYHTSEGTLTGWSYEDLGWDMTSGGIVPPKTS